MVNKTQLSTSKFICSLSRIAMNVKEKIFFSAIGIFFSCSAIFAQEITFQKQTVATGVSKNSGLILADLDNDGDKDLVGNSYDKNDIYWWRNDGGDPINWTKLSIDSNYEGTQYVYADDIDGDGKMDVLSTGSVDAAQVAWWHNDGGNPINWTKQIIRKNFGNAHGIFTRDINGDGSIDILATAAADSLICWWENDGSYPVNWTEHVIDNKSPVSQSVTSDDIDKDGDNDVIATSENKVFLFLNNGGNPINWTKKVIDDNLLTAHWVETADFNNDGNMDIAACGYSETYLRWYENDGSNPITWIEHSVAGKFDGALTVLAVDLNCDERIDLIGTSLPMRELAWWSNDGGDPVNWTKHTISSFKYPWALTADDIDNDGDKDIFAGSNSLGQVLLFENEFDLTSIENSEENGLQGFRLEQNYPNPFNPITNISYQILGAENVELSIVNTLGQKIKTIVDWQQSAGTHTCQWDGTNEHGLSVPSAVYFYNIQAGNYRKTMKMILQK